MPVTDTIASTPLRAAHATAQPSQAAQADQPEIRLMVAQPETCATCMCIELSDDENQVLPPSRRKVRCSACPFKGRRDDWKNHATTHHKVVFAKANTAASKAKRLQQKRDCWHKAKGECFCSAPCWNHLFSMPQLTTMEHLALLRQHQQLQQRYQLQPRQQQQPKPPPPPSQLPLAPPLAPHRTSAAAKVA